MSTYGFTTTMCTLEPLLSIRTEVVGGEMKLYTFEPDLIAVACSTITLKAMGGGKGSTRRRKWVSWRLIGQQGLLYIINYTQQGCRRRSYDSKT